MTHVDLQMESRPGYCGKLNAHILERVRYFASEEHLPDLESKFAHLYANDGSSCRPEALPEPIDVAAYIDHTNLKADADHKAMEKLCKEAEEHHFLALAINTAHVQRCVELLKHSNVRVGAAVSFPLGQTTTAMKVAETREAVANGALDIDFVINVAELKSKNYKYIYDEIKAIVDACPSNVTVKVIFEVCLLSSDEIIDAAILSVAAGAHFVKTSTGFSTGGATPEAIDIMLTVVGKSALVKASGGVRDRETALQYLRAGVRRIGTSASIAICQA